MHFIGGPHATFCHDDLLKRCPEIDAIVRGEAEISFIEFLKKYRNQQNLPTIDGISTKSKLSKKLSPIIKDINSLPFPAYDLVDVTKYQLSTHRKDLPLPFLSSITNRGCPFSCTYCQTPNMFGNKVRFKSPDTIKSELEYFIEIAQIKSIVFWDDTFTFNTSRTLEICKKIKPFNISWMCNTRVELVNPSLLRSMSESGCRIVFFGVESSSGETLKRFKRTYNTELVKKAFDWAHQANIKTVGTLMIGSPGDDLNTIEKNIEYLKSLNPSYVYISIFNVTPGAKEFEKAKLRGKLRDKKGRITEEIDWSDPKLFKGPPFGLPTVNGSLNRYQLQQAQEFAYEQFYGPEGVTEYE